MALQTRIHPITISDRREIEFDAEAIIEVIGGSLERAQAINLPHRKPTGVGFNVQSRQIMFLYPGLPAVTVTAEHLGALLVSYCLKARIPLPRLSDKAIRVEAFTVVLAFTKTYARASSW